MKKLFFVFAMLAMFAPTVDAYQNQSNDDMRYRLDTSHFRDVSPTSQLRPALNWAVDAGYLEPGGFFRPDLPIPAQMFWPLVLKEAGFDPDSAKFQTPLPPNIAQEDAMAQYLREAIRRGFISAEEPFDPLREVSQLEALETLIITKAILPGIRTTATFRQAFPKLPSRATYLPQLEAAYASNMLSKYETANFKSTKKITREMVLTWLYRFEMTGEKKSSLENTGIPSVISDESREKRKNALQKRFAEKRTPSRTTTKAKPTTVKIEMIDDSSLPIKNTRTSNSSRFNLLEQIYDDVINKYRFPEKITEEKKTSND